MLKYRHVYVEFWKDKYICSLSQIEQLVFLYLLTNQDTQQCGIYILDLDVLKIKLKIDDDVIDNIFTKFITDNKIKFNINTNEIAIRNWNKWNNSKSPKVVKHLLVELYDVKDKSLINYCYTDNELEEFDSILLNHNLNCKPQYRMSGSFDEFYNDKSQHEFDMQYRNKFVTS